MGSRTQTAVPFPPRNTGSRLNHTTRTDRSLVDAGRVALHRVSLEAEFLAVALRVFEDMLVFVALEPAVVPIEGLQVDVRA